MALQKLIHTERLILKSITPAWIHELFDTQSKEAIIAYFGLDEQGYALMQKMHTQGMETFRYTSFYFLLVLKENNIPIGECGFHTINHTHRRAELFYLLRDEMYKQKGIMKEALGSVLDYGFNELNLHRIEALVDAANTPSVKLLKHFGFTFEGTMREDYQVNEKNEDSDCYSLLKNEWRK